MPGRWWIPAAAAAALSCAGRPHALDYVVLPNGEDHRRASEERVRLEARADPDDAWPIYGPLPEGAGGSPCGAGLIGTECERGLLSDQAPLDELELLGPDGVVIEEWPLSRRRASGAAPAPAEAPRERPAPATPERPRTPGR